MNPLVSIIIPSYNYAHLIRETLQSVILQTYTNWECLIIDDGSTDDTRLVLNQFISDNSQYNFKYIKTDNQGTSCAKNTGLKYAAGDYIQFLDADDLISKDKLDVQVGLLKENNWALVFSKSVFFVSKGSSTAQINKFPENYLLSQSIDGYDLLAKLLQNNVVTISSPLTKRSLINQTGGFLPSLRYNEDWLFWFKCALHNPFFAFDENESSCTFIRCHENSAMISNSYKMYPGAETVRLTMDQLIQSMQFISKIQRDTLLKKNKDQLALLRILSLDWQNGFKYVISESIKNPAGNFKLAAMACRRFAQRHYRNLLRR